MFFNIIYAVFLMFSIMVVYGILDNRQEIYEYITTKKNQITKLNEFRKKSGITIYSIISLCFVSTYMICKTKLVMTIQSYMDGLNIRQVGRDMFEINLFVKGKYIKMLVKLKRGPNVILQAMNDKDEDITDSVVPYYNYDLCDITPKSVGSNHVEIVTSNGETIKYNEEEKIL